MNEEEREYIVALIQSRYKSLKVPNFSFVNKAISRRPYASVVRQIEKSFDVEEDTDPNEDVSFGYLLTKEQKRWVLRISMVGPYAVLLRLDAAENIKIVSNTTQALSEPEKELIRILSDYGIRLLDRDTLLVPVPLRLFNTKPENTRLYQALFTDLDILPWEKTC